MSSREAQPLSANRLLVCILVNQLGTPGLGSIWAGRKRSGAAQLLLTIAGFTLIMLWMGLLFYRVFRRQLGDAVEPQDQDWMCLWGSISFAAGWCWALATSLSLWRERQNLSRRP